MRGDDAGRTTGQLRVTAAESAAARAVVASIQQRFRVADRAGVPAGAPRGLAPAGGHQLLPAPVLGEAEAEFFRSEGARLRPRIREAALARAVRPAQVSLPERASGAFTVADESTSMSMRVSLVGALDAPAEVAGGFVVYRGGGPDGTHLVHRATAMGTEDFLVLEQAPAEPSVRYEVALSEQVAGLRLVAGCVQLLDAGGAPRLRMAPPYLVDAAGTRHEASVALEDCAFDANPSAPWGRAVTPPGARKCSVHIAWKSDAVSFPALLDPSWTTTGSMATVRYGHTASVLADGRVLVTGGMSGNKWVSSSELYDSATGAWATTGSLAIGRREHTASVLANGHVLAVGGWGAFFGEQLSSSELYDPATGAWTSAANLVTARWDHRAGVLADGRVLVVGGTNSSGGGKTLSSAELYNGGWATTGSLATPRVWHTVSVLGDGRVLVAGGSNLGAVSSAELYNPASGSWTTTGSLASARYHHTASVLGDGRVLIAGGFVGSSVSSAELYDPATGSWSPTGNLATARSVHTASVLKDGRVLVAGGTGPSLSKYLSSAELYDPASGSWTPTAKLATARAWHTASALGDGRVLVAGGSVSSAELYDLGAPLGTQCSQGTQCASDHCVDGVCCNTACGGGLTGDCAACSVSAGSSTNGNCEPLTDGSVCDDGLFCNGTETCNASVCGNSTGDPCSLDPTNSDCTEACDETAKSCSGWNPNGSACKDGTCQQGNCEVPSGGGTGGVGSSAGSGGTPGGTGGVITGGTGGSGGTTGGTGGGVTGGTGGGRAAAPADERGCDCRAAGGKGGVGSGWLALLGLGALLGRRWRTAPSGHRRGAQGE